MGRPVRQPITPSYESATLGVWLPPSAQVSPLVQQVGISRAGDVRNLVPNPPVVDLEADCDGCNDE